MNTRISSAKPLQQATSAGYNTQLVARHLRRRRLYYSGWATVAIVLVFAAFAFVANYFARIPVERSQEKYSFFQRVQHGGNMTWLSFVDSLGTTENHPKESKLPATTLRIQGNRLHALDAHLPESGRAYQTAYIKLNGKEYRAKVRYRGDSLNHWAFPQKSWRVKLTRGKSFQGMQYFNLYQPRTQSQLSEQLSYEMAERMGGLLSPRAFYTHFRLNGRFDGIRMFLEQVNEDFLAARGRIPGDILIGDISTEDIYTQSMHNRKLLFGPTDAKNWETIGLNIDKGVADTTVVEHPKLKGLLTVLNQGLSPAELERILPEYVDMESTLRYMALLEIVGSMHIDATHNHKWYLDSSSGLLHPIVWDPLAYLWGDRPGIDLDHNLLFRVILTCPSFRTRKNQIVWEAIEGPLHEDKLQKYLKETADTIRKDVYDNYLKIKATRTQIHYNSNKDWEVGVKNLIDVTATRNKKIRRALQSLDSKAHFSAAHQAEQPFKSGLLQVEVTSHSGLALRGIRFKLPKATNAPVEFKITRTGGTTNNMTHKTSIVPGVINPTNPLEIVLPVNENLQSLRSIKPETGRLQDSASLFTYKIESSEPLQELVALEGFNPINKIKGTVAPHPTELKHPAGVWDSTVQTSVVLQGNVELKETLVVGRGSSLTILPGTHLKLDPKVSIITQGVEVHAQGTGQEPIVISRNVENAPWGSLGIIQSPNANLQHIRLEGGSSITHQEAYFPGALSLHHSKVFLKNVSLINGELSTQFSTGSARNITIDTPSGIPLHKEGSTIAFQEPPLIQKTYKAHSVSYLDKPAIGTPPRLEREYKFSISVPFAKNSSQSLEDLSMSNIVSLTSSALEKAASDHSRWSAPKFALEPAYRVATATEANVYRDIYMDTPDRLCYKHDLSYRLRHRFADIKSYDNYLYNPELPRFWPYRLEFQAKTHREIQGPGLSSIHEARLEFRQQSKPFDSDRLRPPPPPWLLAEYIPWMASGTFRGEVGTPGKHIVAALHELYPDTSTWNFEPVAVVVSERGRAHLQLKTPWGSGPNPDQAFIITIDRTQIYPYEQFSEFEKTAPLESKKSTLKNAGTLLEFEIEFERNVSEGVIKEREKIEAALAAFLKDQEQILIALQEGLGKSGYSITPMSRSKYLQAVDILK
jgi:hypothetical protein